MGKKVLLVPLIVLLIAVLACGSSSVVLPTATSKPAAKNTKPAATSQPATKAAKPTKPAAKPTPTEVEMEPTKDTSQPTTLPGELDDTFSGLEVLYYDGFDPVVADPEGWDSSQPDTLSILPSGKMAVQMTTGYGGVFWFAQENLSPMQGVFLTFKYTGNEESLTLGMDRVDDNGDVLPNTDELWHSFAMGLVNTDFSIHCSTSSGVDQLSYEGDLSLAEDTWYDIAMGFDDQNQYVMQIWDPDDPASQLFILQTCDTDAITYDFISWITPKRSLQIDDFTIFQFEEIVAAPTEGE